MGVAAFSGISTAALHETTADRWIRYLDSLRIASTMRWVSTLTVVTRDSRSITFSL
jgi:hypothetical protein